MAVAVVELHIELQERREHSRFAIPNTEFEIVDVCFPVEQILLRNAGKLDLLDTLILRDHRFNAGWAEAFSRNWHPIMTQL